MSESPLNLQTFGRAYRPWSPMSYWGVWRMGDTWDGELWQFLDRPVGHLFGSKCRTLASGRFEAIEVRLRGNGQLCRFRLK